MNRREILKSGSKLGLLAGVVGISTVKPANALTPDQRIEKAMEDIEQAMREKYPDQHVAVYQYQNTHDVSKYDTSHNKRHIEGFAIKTDTFFRGHERVNAVTID